MIKYLVLTLLLVCNISFASVSQHSVHRVYSHIVAANHIKHAPRLIILHTDEINAYSGGNVIMVTTGLMRAVSINELALVLGHELSHSLGTDYGFGKTKEISADTNGARLASNAGYNMCRGANFFKKIPEDGTDHPASSKRYYNLYKRYCR